MKYPWIDEYLMAKRGVTKDLQEEWNWIRYHIGGKMFAAVLLDDSNQPYYINLKLEPMEGELMRQQYPDIIPGYYSNKQHWNSVNAERIVPPVRFTAVCAPDATKLVGKCFTRMEKPARSMLAAPISTVLQTASPAIGFPVKSGRRLAIRP